MKNTNNIHGYSRLFLCAAIFCLILVGTGFRSQPVPIHSKEDNRYFLFVGFMTPSQESICQGRSLPLEMYFSLNLRGLGNSPIVPLADWEDAEIDMSAKLGTLDRTTASVQDVYLTKMYTVKFNYRAPKDKEGAETVTVWVRLGNWKEKAEFSFRVKPCKFSVRGTTDVTKPFGAAMSAMGWDPVGSYDVYGTLEQQEDGSLRGEATASLYSDAIWTGEGLSNGEFTCEVTSPLEGVTTVEMEADPNAWAHEGELDITFTIQPMPLTALQVNCYGDGGSGEGGVPANTIALFDLNFDAIPSGGGSTDLDFHFPQGQGELEMDLIVSPEEVES